MNDPSSQLASRAWIRALPTSRPVRVFGLSPEEHAARALRLAGVTHVSRGATPPRAGPDGGSVLALRGDFLFDPRLVAALAARPGVLLIEPATRRAVAAHVPAARLAACADWLRDDAVAGEGAADLRRLPPAELAPSYTAALRAANPPYLYDLAAATGDDARRIEDRIYADAYKGVTDLVTKWIWPRPARFVVKRCAAAGIHPNAITLASWVLVALAFSLFAKGSFGAGLLVAWVMTFLDTVDGKLARVTLQTSRVGHVLDHGLDLVHPPFWWWAWGAGVGLATPWVAAATWICVAGYGVGRAIEGLFLLRFKLEIHSWRPLDSRFRTITARRNPNLLLLSVATGAGRPDLGLAALAAWTACCIAFHGWRVWRAWIEQRAGRAITPWYASPAAAGALALLLWGGAALAPGLARASEPLPARSRLASGELAMEQWDLCARFDSGHVVLAQFLVTNLGFGDRNAAVTGHVIAPDGSVRHFRTGKSEGDWRLSDDGLRLEVGKAVLDQRTHETRLRVERKTLRIDLRFRTDVPAARPAGALARDGYDLDLLRSADPIAGTLWTEGMPAPLEVRGRVTLTHRSMDALESRLVRRRIEVQATAGDATVYLLDALRPDGASERWLVIGRGDATRVESSAVEVSIVPDSSRPDDGFGGPRELRFRSATAEGRVRFERDLVRYDPLADLPAPIRLVISVASRPLRTWSAATLELWLREGAATTTLRGTGIGDVTFLNPMPLRTALRTGDAFR